MLCLVCKSVSGFSTQRLEALRPSQFLTDAGVLQRAEKPPSPPPPPRASYSRHGSSPRPSSSSSTLDRLGAIERDVGYIKQEQKKMKKTVSKMFKYLSAISKSCRRDDVAATPSSSPPPPDSD
ncbi:hypothetical protein MRB53_030656 [Persea americana]|uniref:Uncharacterized protein n=1 Tax=Persea americana TaxID=3435 RepID=A0ACC2KMW8_PERAE|nr:hypothetical protein MRB53_030656 [Persea americana]